MRNGPPEIAGPASCSGDPWLNHRLSRRGTTLFRGADAWSSGRERLIPRCFFAMLHGRKNSTENRTCCLPRRHGESFAKGPEDTFHGQPSIAGWRVAGYFLFEWVPECIFPGRRFRKSSGNVSAANRTDHEPGRSRRGNEDRLQRVLRFAYGHWLQSASSCWAAPSFGASVRPLSLLVGKSAKGQLNQPGNIRIERSGMI